MQKNQFTIASFYKFKKIANPQKLQNLLKEFCQFNKLKGTILIAQEGINANVSGFDTSIKNFKKKLIDLGFTSLEIKLSYYPIMPFNRLKIKIKKEIITFCNTELDVEKNTAKFVSPENWNKLIQKKDIHIIDVRNDYESKMGTFSNSKKTNTKNFNEFKRYIKENLTNYKYDKIAMFCTGGIRCEKASSYMLKLGFKNLYQLQGGILKYLETVQKSNSNWKGECFIFDNRVSVKNEMKKGSYDLCHGCRMPINKKDKLSTKFEEGVTCSYCYGNLTTEKKKKLRERNRQIGIAKKRGLYNPYIRYSTSDYK
ncbi:MAG: hypothetical protein CFH21_00852 [Alphaproteobacteria bacterium MarineAlpha5_Bin11]|nr:hypothetical protein [Pelagibacteraceae bacterium]PPR43264.1 MAG: hypothetical protein CFH21_00852 [Alphaproteobacteria bacterium MarineAlpha5_Bin11]|tara:strand:+ start:4691 stop:5626 length:936 start_codon:yes stop_codon:yes gene_type:complete